MFNLPYSNRDRSFGAYAWRRTQHSRLLSCSQFLVRLIDNLKSQSLVSVSANHNKALQYYASRWAIVKCQCSANMLACKPVYLSGQSLIRVSTNHNNAVEYYASRWAIVKCQCSAIMLVGKPVSCFGLSPDLKAVGSLQYEAWNKMQ